MIFIYKMCYNFQRSVYWYIVYILVLYNMTYCSILYLDIIKFSITSFHYDVISKEDLS